MLYDYKRKSRNRFSGIFYDLISAQTENLGG